MNKKLWMEIFAENDVPAFPCPACGVGHLHLRKESLQKKRPAYVTFERFEAEPENSPERFTMFLECTSPKCGEVVAVAGTVVVVEDDDDGRWCLVSALKPYTMFPAPPIIAIPTNVPTAVRDEIERSFRLF
jgi:hypothetical protein